LHYIPVIIANYQKDNSLLDRILQKLKCSSASPVAIRLAELVGRAERNAIAAEVYAALCVHKRRNRTGRGRMRNRLAQMYQDDRDHPWTRDLRKCPKVINPRMSMGNVGYSGFLRSVTNQVAPPAAEQE
jgi:hypothetical protein